MSALLWLLTALATAHTDPAPRGVELELRGGRPSLAVTVVIQPPSEARLLTELADRDHDGRLDEDEARRVERALTANAAQVVKLTLDGVWLPLTPSLEASFGLRGPIDHKAPVGVAARAEAATLVLCGLHLVKLESRSGGPGKTRVTWPDGRVEELGTGERAVRVVFLCGS